MNAQILEVSHHDTWIVDGNYTKMGDDLASRATYVILLYPPLYQQLWRLMIREVIWRSPFSLATITPARKKAVKDESNPESIVESLRILGGQAVKYYRYRTRHQAYHIRHAFPHIGVIIHRERTNHQAQLLHRLSAYPH